MTDDEIILLHDPSARRRARMEVKIVTRVLKDARRKGYSLSIPAQYYDGEEVVDGKEFIGRKGPSHDIRDAVFNLDEAYIQFRRKDKDCGWIRFIFGSDGHDCINDYSTKLEAFLKPINELSDRLANGLA